MSTPELKVVAITTIAQWERWLDKNHARTPQGVWLRVYKKAAAKSSPPHRELVEAALCYGWIDGQAKPYDDDSSLRKFTPRRARSVWSKINTELVAQLTKAGRMQPAGLAEVEAAKADGRWANAYDSYSNATVPDDFLAALHKNKLATAFYETLTKRNTYPIVHRLQTAKKPETRERRIVAIIEMFERGEKFHE